MPADAQAPLPSRLRGGGVVQRRDDDCLRSAIASLMSIPYELLPDVDHESGDWIGDYNAALRDAAWPLALISCAAYDAPGGRWIAVVPSLTQPAPAKHAVVMDCHRLYHDPGRKVVYTVIEPEAVKCGILVVVVGDGWMPSRASTWRPRELTGLGEGESDA